MPKHKFPFFFFFSLNTK